MSARVKLAKFCHTKGQIGGVALGNIISLRVDSIPRPEYIN
jgi:hypothetical protein